nr:hypothetical protein NG677_04345 [Methylobacterium sp. OTU13CASTA1]
MTIPDRELENSPLSGLVTRDGVTVNVLIYRFLGTTDPWSLEVADQEGSSTVWTENFPTDHAAHEAFLRALEADGMGQFLEPGETLH